MKFNEDISLTANMKQGTFPPLNTLQSLEMNYKMAVKGRATAHFYKLKEKIVIQLM